jgi:RNA polymerase sigma factor (sigma-70 family)
MTPSVNELYELAVSGNREAEAGLFAALTDRFRLFAHLRVWDRDEEEDLVQSALAVVAVEYRNVAIETSFAAWAHKIMQNRLLGYIQKRRREKGRTISSETDEYWQASRTPDPTLRMRLLTCLKRVGVANRRYARILNLHHIGFSRAEVCKKLGVTREQSYLIMSRARAMLKMCLDKGDIS